MDPYILFLIGLGAVVLLTAWLPMLLRPLPLSLPILCVLFGAILFSFVDAGAPLPFEHVEITRLVTEVIVIIALMGAGLKIDRPIGWRRWRTTWRLLAIAMPLSIAGMTFLGWGLLGLGLPTALLLAAALAPTDPVLASDVQVGPPKSGEDGEARFALTSEAGLNDGLAFPFVNLAIAIALAAAGETEPGGWLPHWLADWLLIDVIWKIAAGCFIGWAVGWGFAWLSFRLPRQFRLSTAGDGFAALGMIFISYGVAEAAGSYGFVAVFVTALALRDAEPDHDYHVRLHDFAEQIERVAMMLMLVLFGGALTSGLLAEWDWAALAFGAVCLLVVRPLSGLISLSGLACPFGEKAVIAFFGIRGIGSAYYLAYGLTHAEVFERPEYLWSVIALIILASIVLHGVTVTPALREIDK
jgi:NhaP-type Na+/H+ or K+/H+ antiporter